MTESFASLFEETFASQTIKTGSIIKGTIIAIDSEFVTVSAGLKSEAIIPLSQFGSEKDDISVGEEIEVSLDSFEDGFGETKLSREKAIDIVKAENEPRFEKIEEYLELIDIDYESTIDRILSFSKYV